MTSVTEPLRAAGGDVAVRSDELTDGVHAHQPHPVDCFFSTLLEVGRVRLPSAPLQILHA